jgi:hypothetical protein
MRENARNLIQSIILATLIGVALSPSAVAQTALTPAQLTERTFQRRAIEAVNWGMPVVNFDQMVQAMLGAKGAFNQIVYWSSFSDWKNQTLTPNPDTIYFKPFIDTKDVGPMVLEIPPASDAGSITGTIMDCWQAALEDVGPAGVDKGNGGKYLIIPAGYKDTPPDGYIILPSQTYQGFALLRSIVRGGSSGDIAKAVDYGKQIKLYPLSRAASPPQTIFVDMINVVFDATIPYDMRFFQSLDRMVQSEPWLPRDKVMIDMLKSIGIEKGKPFKPDAKAQAILSGAAREAHGWLNARYETVFPPYYGVGQWFIPATEDLRETASTFYETENAYSVDARGLTDYWAFSTIKHLGAGQFYLMAIRDKTGAAFDGSKNYRLTVPANAPVKQYWSAVVYDRATHALIRNAARLSRSSQNPDLKKNADGSVDVYFGPKAPAGNQSNWIATNPDGKFEVLFRLYGPEKPLFDKTWKLPDIEKVAAR